MKFSIAYYLVLLYVTVLFKPLIPLIIDVVSHEFNGLEHISSVHAKYGNDHLQKELADSSSDKEGTKKQNSVKSAEDVSFHLPQSANCSLFQAANADLEFIVANTTKLPFVFILNQSPPPKFS